ncbi:MAG: 30S ribosomal protein S6--L-glutamate ligase [Bacteroidetes bacterium]|nr:30S ribosomal protein S6--L-glutamate ligase [Bacteroidota bacterium]
MHLAILSRNANLYSTKRLVQAAEQRGHRVTVIDVLKCNLLMEKRNPGIYYQNGYLTDVDGVIPRIGASVTFYGTAVVRQFEMKKVFSAVESQALVRSRDKLRSLQILSRAGLGLPKTVFTNFARNVDPILEILGTPVVIKILEGTQGLGVVLAENRNAAKSVVEAFHSLKVRIIMQEFIAEAKGADIRAFVVDGKVVGAMKRQAKEGEFRSNLHQGGTASVVRLSAEEKETALRAAKAMGLGVAGVDMLQSKRGPLVMEVNSSPGLEGIERATGKDIAGKIIQYMERNQFRNGIQKDRINA